MKKASLGIKGYIKSVEYILLVIICLAYSAFIFLGGYSSSDGVMILLNDKIYLNFGLLLFFLIYIYRNIRKDPKKTLLENWLDNARLVIVLSIFTFISLVVISLTLGEILGLLNLSGEHGVSPVIEGIKGYRDISVIQTFTGLSYLGVLTMTLSFEDSRLSKFFLLALAIYYFLRIFFPSNKDFLWIFSPINQLSAYSVLAYNKAGPYLMAIFHCLGLVVIGNIVILIERGLEKIK